MNEEARARVGPQLQKIVFLLYVYILIKSYVCMLLVLSRNKHSVMQNNVQNVTEELGEHLIKCIPV